MMYSRCCSNCRSFLFGWCHTINHPKYSFHNRTSIYYIHAPCISKPKSIYEKRKEKNTSASVNVKHTNSISVPPLFAKQHIHSHQMNFCMYFSFINIIVIVVSACVVDFLNKVGNKRSKAVTSKITKKI